MTEEARPQDSASRVRNSCRTAAQDTGPAQSSGTPVAARAHRCNTRSTLQLSVQDFNGKIINRNLGQTDEDCILWTVTGDGGAGGDNLKLHLSHSGSPSSHAKHPADDRLLLLQHHQHQHQLASHLPPPATFRWSATASPLHIDSAHLLLAPNAPKSERVAAWTEDVHRRHVARTARARARLTLKPWSKERVVAASNSGQADPANQNGCGVLETSFRLAAADTPEVVGDVGGSGSGGFAAVVSEDDAAFHSRMVTPSQQTSTPRKDSAPLTSRSSSRPATTSGRYFARCNGLKITSSNSYHADTRTRPRTAGQRSWTSSGLNIQKVVLHPKQLM
ncbi:uncharacterized protein LOC143282412 [Babylonia areolata]|uniref:uncharacterized protein LOC143282412 n=1 Tax=Babylonia areolata TaxID=304850 RepID=UPI003FD29A6E